MKGIAFRSQKASRPEALVCQFCRFSSKPVVRQTPFARRYASTASFAPRFQPSQLRPRKDPRNLLIVTRSVPGRLISVASDASTLSDPESALRQLSQESSKLRNVNSVPSNEAILQILRNCEQIAEALVSREQDHKESPSSAREEGNAISSLLDLEEKNASKKRSKSVLSAQPHLADAVTEITTELLQDEKVFISPEALASYTKTQTLLKRAEHFPEIFHMYAHKPIPEENSSPVKYHKANPKSVNSAIPAELANSALAVAIEQRNLSLVLSIIDNTFCAPAYHRAKLFRKAAVPLGGLAATPAACYAIASWASTLQNTMDPSTATGIAFAATLAYVGGTSSIGLLAITSANDQMERVTWVPGIPLRHRWLREEERAALDKVAVAWGFKDIYMRGEEEGEEWDNLREFIGMRGMILDKTELMPGME
ncbi:uncharacterized protein ACLA_023950 [Aspergillus clavatus NRRL 1]|uniref:Uncharacterized protein n=1 Tax=Aspergillus clavatus (strain ATCC 1007 / CBS 513.65 / DSM 816 / NCTC 3887 / NRRL 1 / QM 1276 / 107) TaxID=344612 RepID=A1CPV9_ASPCL|nr:uncharacterized protein ACLA_023950 [Aspergillus clavatus NRRL 1]EAW07680.1 conserved hypothetical protein [Aspergillus clavatus NRRL 1]